MLELRYMLIWISYFMQNEKTRTEGYDLLYTSVMGIDFSLLVVTFDLILNYKVNLAKVCYEPSNDCASICQQLLSI